MRIDSLPRCALAHLPTPLEELKTLSRQLAGPQLLIKRDDQTGLALGGNKTRKLEFLVGHALQQGADTLVSLWRGAIQSLPSDGRRRRESRSALRTDSEREKTGGGQRQSAVERIAWCELALD